MGHEASYVWHLGRPCWAPEAVGFEKFTRIGEPSRLWEGAKGTSRVGELRQPSYIANTHREGGVLYLANERV